MKKVLIAMSGGVDSSVAACLMKKKGYDIIGVTMKLYDNNDIYDNNNTYDSSGIYEASEKSCCSLSDAEDARAVAHILHFPYYIFNFKANFKHQVIDRFIAAYENGETPNPCISCNRYLKFEELYRRASELHCDCIATGHYAQIEENEGRYLLKKAADPQKDQSYVLYMLTQTQLAHTIFPLGDLTKTETRQIAEENGLLNADKHESQDICFVPDGDYASFIKRTTGKIYPEGDFVDTNGNILGRHKGIIHYTIGQRRGLGLSLPAPLYVMKKDLANNRIILCTNEELFKKEMDVAKINWITADEFTAPFRAEVKIRYSHKAAPATIIPDKTCAHVIFDEPQRAITDGQAAVFYHDSYVIGGGKIISAKD